MPCLEVQGAQSCRRLVSEKSGCPCRRNVQGANEDDVDIPSATNTALTWAFFMGTSANIRYQVLHTLLLGATVLS